MLGEGLSWWTRAAVLGLWAQEQVIPHCQGCLREEESV